MERQRPARKSDGSRVAARMALCAALSRFANGCFKAGCVAESTDACRGHLDAAEEAIAEARESVAGLGPSQQLGQAVLVHGVTVVVRAGLPPGEGGAPQQDLWERAVELFTEAEAILVQSVGEVNECSIYTHANLSEVYFRRPGARRR